MVGVNKIRRDVYDLMLDIQIPSEPVDVKRTLRKARVVHSAISEKIYEKDADGKCTNVEVKQTERSHFPVLARVAETKHMRYIEEFKNTGHFYEGIKTNPLDSKLPDEKIVMADTTMGIKRQKTMAGGVDKDDKVGITRVISAEGRHVIHANDKALAVIRRYIVNFKARQEAKDKKKKAAEKM